jgi:Cd2+/Zn2+-exporting ATPase
MSTTCCNTNNKSQVVDLEIILTTSAFVFMIAGRLSQHLHIPTLYSTILYILAFMTGGYYGTIGSIKTLRQGVIDVDLLMVLAALGAAYVGAPFEGAMLLFLFSLSNALQTFAIGRTRRAIEKLAQMRPQQAYLLHGRQTELVPINKIDIGNLILIRPGDLIPLDGEIVEGESTIDQSTVTGESMPSSKTKGDSVFAGTQNQFGSLTVKVTKRAEDSTLAKMIQHVEEAQAQKARTQRFLENFEQTYALGVIGITISLIILLPTLFKVPYNKGFYEAITVMVVASPCALVIGTPAAILSAIANGARKGILFKGGVHLENASSISIVAFDKTGTLTNGKPEVSKILPLNHHSETDLLTLAASIEAKSEHPLAKAIVEYALQQGITLQPITFFQAITGKGTTARINDQRFVIGSPNWIREFKVKNSLQVQDQLTSIQNQGQTALILGEVAVDGITITPIGIIGLSDHVRPESREVVTALKSIGIKRVVMLTGDSQAVAQAIARETGVDEVYAELLPIDKVRLLKKIAKGQGIAMVGDGTNDAPALAASTLGIAMGAAGSDIALESADVVLMANDLKRIPQLISLSKEAQRIIIQNLCFAIAVIICMVFATLFCPLIGWIVPLPLGVVAHEGGTVLVCLNGLRLLTFK